MNCNRCGAPIAPGKDESCWWCIEALCYSCWDEYGHCGHTEADEWNERARRVPQPPSEPLTYDNVKKAMKMIEKGHKIKCP